MKPAPPVINTFISLCSDVGMTRLPGQVLFSAESCKYIDENFVATIDVSYNSVTSIDAYIAGCLIFASADDARA